MGATVADGTDERGCLRWAIVTLEVTIEKTCASAEGITDDVTTKRTGREVRLGTAAALLVAGGLLAVPTQAHAADGPYGAIAYSQQTQRYGVATGKSTAKKASKSAKNKCASPVRLTARWWPA